MTVPPSGAEADGLVIVDKPAGWTSHDVVARTRRLAGTRKVGHAGTLDPMATGVLVLGVNRATRLLTYLVGADKTYTATIRLGVTTITDDAEGDVLEVQDASGVQADALRAAVRDLTGPIAQVPSSVSAIKVDGQRSYARVRSGKAVELAPRPVTVHRFDLLGERVGEHEGTPVLDIDVEVECSSGTYVRALARDLGRTLMVGAALGVGGAMLVGGHLTALRRTRVGPYGLERARSLEQLQASFVLLPAAEAARAAFPVRDLTDDEVTALGHGKRLPAVGQGEGPIAAISPDGRLIALLLQSGTQARPVLVMVPAGEQR